ncbi:MAG: PPOX class F420-dependent oxidoreductase [Chloroflexota bacterium]
MVEIPKSHADILDSTALAHVGTVNPDGSPQVTPIWFNHADGHILINSAEGRKKDRNMRARPEVGLSIVDPNNAYRYLGIQGTVVEITAEGGEAHIHELAHKYMGRDYPNINANETRVIYKIEPTRVWTMG